MRIEDLIHYKKILIVGYGIEGEATRRFLNKFHPNAHVDVVDQKDGNDYLKSQELYELAIKSPSVRKEQLTIPYTTATNLFFANCPSFTIGITGTKGKSTTATLLYQLLIKKNRNTFLAGNIGKPMLDLLTHNEIKEGDYVVLELSSYQLDDMQYSPHISIILNINEAHLNYHDTYENYVHAKLNIASHATPSDFYIYNDGNQELTAAKTKARKIPFQHSLLNHNTVHQNTIDALLTCSHILNYSENDIKEVLSTFKNLPHRLQFIGNYQGITFIDDSASTTPSATIFALQSFKNIETLICGGIRRNQSLEEIYSAVKKAGVQHVAVFPDVSLDLIELCKDKEDHIDIQEVHTMRDAVIFSFEHTKPGNICLLSPGFASYNMYSGFPARGDDFQKCVQEYSINHAETPQTENS